MNLRDREGAARPFAVTGQLEELLMQNRNLANFLHKYRFLVTGGVALLAILMAMLLSGLLILFIGIDPILAYRYFFYGIFGNVYGFGETFNKFIPLLCCALSFSIAQKSGFFNLGCEGQFYMGALGTVLVGLHLTSLPPILHITLAILAGILGGAFLSAVAGVLKIFFRANELLSTMMLNYLMTLFISLLVSGVLKDPKSYMEQTAAIAGNIRLPIILNGSRLHMGIFIALLATLFIWFLQQRTVPGFEMRLSGANPKSARYAGVNARKSLILVIIISGALSGLGGALELLGNQYKLMVGFSNNYGFDAIGIAVMGQYNPIGIILASFLFAALRVGTSSMQRGVGVPLPLLYILQGVIIIAVIVSNYFVRKIMDSMVEGRA